MLVIVGEYKEAVIKCEQILIRSANWNDPDCVIHGFLATAICRLDPELTNEAIVRGHKCLLGCLHDGNWQTSLKAIEFVGNLALIFKYVFFFSFSSYSVNFLKDSNLGSSTISDEVIFI